MPSRARHSWRPGSLDVDRLIELIGTPLAALEGLVPGGKPP